VVVAPAAADVAAPSYAGTVVGADGQPVSRAEVFLTGRPAMLDITKFGWQDNVPVTKTGPDGTFSFPPEPNPVAIVVRSSAGFAEVPVEEFARTNRVVIQPWARVEGVLMVGKTPTAGETIRLAFRDDQDWARYQVQHTMTTRTREDGTFIFARVPAGPVRLSRQLGLQAAPILHSTLVTTLEAPPGQTTKVVLGGKGRPVVGKITVAEAGAEADAAGVKGKAPPADEMDRFMGWLIPDDATAATRAPAGPSTKLRAPKQPGAAAAPESFGFVAAADGSFRVDDVPAGRYRIAVQAFAANPGSRLPEIAAHGEKDLTVGPIPGGRSDRPLDVGTVVAQAPARFKPGDAAPDFKAVRQVGGTLKLLDFRGKHVLLIVRQQVAPKEYVGGEELNIIWDRFGPTGRVTVLELDATGGVQAGASVTPTTPTPPTAGGERAAWVRARLSGDPSKDLPVQYTRGPVPVFLIDPAGKLVTKNVHLRSVMPVIDQALGMTSSGAAGAVVTAEHNALPKATALFRFAKIPRISGDDAGRGAQFVVVDGRVCSDSAQIRILNDGAGPAHANEPQAAFFFEHDTLEGRFRADLSATTAVRRVNTYSWHVNTRGPQVYRLYGSDGAGDGFDPAPRIGVDPARCGWKLIASVDTRPADGMMGGQDAVSIAGPGGKPLGNFRHLLFVTFVTETHDGWGHTFLNEVDVEADAAALAEGRP
jgi:hypothetical protein